MNCKGSPYSLASTGVAASPARKVKLSRKFKIDLTEKNEKEKDNEIEMLEKKLLRYRRKCREKERRVKEIIQNNVLERKNCERAERMQSGLLKEFEKETTLHQHLQKEHTGTLEKIAELGQKAAKLADSSDFPENPDLTNTSLLEDLQEKLFSSNKKASDLERHLSKVQKKNEGLTKDLRNLRIEVQSQLN